MITLHPKSQKQTCLKHKLLYLSKYTSIETCFLKNHMFGLRMQIQILSCYKPQNLLLISIHTICKLTHQQEAPKTHSNSLQPEIVPKHHCCASSDFSYQTHISLVRFLAFQFLKLPCIKTNSSLYLFHFCNTIFPIFYNEKQSIKVGLLQAIPAILSSSQPLHQLPRGPRKLT